MGNNRYVKRVLNKIYRHHQERGNREDLLKKHGEGMKEDGITWLSIDRTAQKRTRKRWRALVEALCAPEQEESGLSERN